MPATISVPKRKIKQPPLTIHLLGDRVLRQPAKRVTQINDELRQIIRQMLQTMYSADGIGLAAPQVGIHKRLIVIDVEPDNPRREPLILINPEIRKRSENEIVVQEGCLSIPDVFIDVKRSESITVAFKDERGRPRQIEAKGLLARVILHEMDHLEGILFVDHVENELLLHQELQAHGFDSRDVIHFERAV